MSKKKCGDEFIRSDYFWQSENYNARAFAKNFSMIIALAVNRFRWVGMPDSCDDRFFEWQLHKCGIATMCHEKEMPDVWQTLVCAPHGTFNAYGLPTTWRAIGYEGLTNYEVDFTNGDMCWYSNTRTNPWNAFEYYARKLAHYERTEDINLTHQHTPYVMTAPQQQRQQLINLMKQVVGGEPVVLGDKGLGQMASEIDKIDLEIPFIGEDLARAKQNVLNDMLMFLGIPHLAFEKGERMIEQEAKANTSPTNIMLIDCLKARRDFCKKMKRFGLNLEVYFNEDWESYNFNYTNNIEAQAQDGLIAPAGDGGAE